MAKFTCNFISYTLKRTVDITVVIPSVTIPESMGMVQKDGKAPECTHAPQEKYPVLYLLHGMGNNHATWTGYTNVEMFAEERQIAVVNLSAENKSYVKVGGDDFFTFVSKELPDFVCGMFPISDRPEHSYIAGLSMGGFGTLVHALNFPERFAAFGAFSAAVHLNPEQLLGGNVEGRFKRLPILGLTLKRWQMKLSKPGRNSPRPTLPAVQRIFCLRQTGSSVTSWFLWARM